MLVLKHISSYSTSSEHFIFQLLAMLQPKPLLRLGSLAALSLIKASVLQCCVLRLKPAKHQLHLRSGERPQLSEKEFVFCQNFKSVFTALNSLGKILLLFFFLQTEFFPVFPTLSVTVQWQALVFWPVLQRMSAVCLPPSRADYPRCAGEAQQKC